MPIYEYQCQKCGHLAEVFQTGTTARSPRCGECGGRTKRIISPTAFILKGSGWYVTDYPSKSRKEGMEAEKKGKTKKEPAPKKEKGKPSGGG